MDPFASDIIFDAPTPRITIPPDSLSAPAPTPSTIYYLTMTTPHADAFEWHGPATHFGAFLPVLRASVRRTPRARAKLEAILAAAGAHGFTTVVLEGDGEGEPEKFTVLRVLREENAAARAVMPAPVYTVVRQGPCVHDVDFATGRVVSGRAKGKAETSRIVGTFAERKDARAAAEQAMAEMLAGEDDAPKATARFPAGDAGAGVIMAVGTRAVWQVTVFFETDALRGAKARFDAEEKNVAKGRTASWRLDS